MIQEHIDKISTLSRLPKGGRGPHRRSETERSAELQRPRDSVVDDGGSGGRWLGRVGGSGVGVFWYCFFVLKESF